MKKIPTNLNKASKPPSITLNAICSKDQQNGNELMAQDASCWLFFDWDSHMIEETKPTQDIDHVSELLGIQNRTIVLSSKPLSPVWLKRKRAVTYSNPSEHYNTERNQDVDQNGFLIPMICKNEIDRNFDDIKVDEKWTDFT